MPRSEESQHLSLPKSPYTLKSLHLQSRDRLPSQTMFTLLFSLRDCFRARAVLQAEILALRHQLLVLQRSSRGHSLPLRWADQAMERALPALHLLFAKMQGGTQNQSLSCFAPETSSKEKVLEGPHVLLLRQTVELGQRSPAGKFLFPFSLRNSVVAVVQ